MMVTKLSIPSGFVPFKMLRYTAGLHGRAHPGELIAQPTENSLDAGGNVWIVLKGGRNPSISIIDDGCGMLPDILPADKEILEGYLSDLQDTEKEVPDEDAILKKLHEASLHSIMWMIRYIGLSPHVSGEDPFVMALLGIGTKAFYVWANSASYYTRPNMDLARAFWGDSVTPEDIPTIKYQPPTGEQLQGRVTSNVIEYPSEPLRDHKGNLLNHGTRLDITELKADVMEKLTPGVVAAYLSGRFVKILREKNVKITVVDQVTEAGMATEYGIEIPVQPPVYDVGVQLYSRTDYISVMGTLYPIEINIRYLPGKKVTRKVQVRREGGEVCDITDIPELNGAPWEQVTGYADFPSIPGRNDSLWTPDKTLPMPNSAAYNHWTKHMINVGLNILEAIASYEDKAAEESQQKIASRVTDSILQAMQDLPAFSHLAGPKKKPKKKRAPVHKKKREYIETRTFISVVNEHGKGIRGLTVKIQRSGIGEEPIVQTTDTTGKVSFGELKYGRYAVTLVTIPKGARLAAGERQTVSFNINENYPRKHYTFILATGESKPVKLSKAPPVLRVWAHELASAEELYYFGRYSLGMIEINTATEEHLQAVIDKDEELQLLIQSLYTSAAMSELAFFGPPPEDEEVDETRALVRVMLIQQSKLFVRAYSNALMVQRADARKKKPREER